MIIAITEFNLRPDTSRSEVTELYRRSAKAWVKNKDLVQKYYFYDEANCRAGGIYVWTSREAAQRWLGEDYRDMGSPHVRLGTADRDFRRAAACRPASGHRSGVSMAVVPFPAVG
jgi:hypothetical protein